MVEGRQEGKIVQKLSKAEKRRIKKEKKSEKQRRLKERKRLREEYAAGKDMADEAARIRAQLEESERKPKRARYFEAQKQSSEEESDEE